MSLPERVRIANAKWHSDVESGPSIPTCHLHSYTKAVLTALEIQEGSVDVVWVAGASGAAFRIWAQKDLCPSATSVFNWAILPNGLRNAGYNIQYFSRLWHEESVAEERRLAAHEAIKKAIAEGKAPVSWDIGIPEWGVITGYDDAKQEYEALSVLASAAPLKYEQLGQRDIRIMSVTIIDGHNDVNRKEVMLKSFRMALRHANQEEWTDRPDYQNGLPAYETWANGLGKLAESGGKQNMLSYYSGTYLAARHYARRYMEMAVVEFGGDEALLSAAEAYKQVEAALQDAYRIICKDQQPRNAVELEDAARAIRAAGECEANAIGYLKAFLATAAVA